MVYLSGQTQAPGRATQYPVSPAPRISQSDAGVFGAGVHGEGHYSMYENCDIELDPRPSITAVLTVAYIPPEESSGGSIPRVSCFVIDAQAQSRPHDSQSSANGVLPVWMECAPSRLPSAGVRGAATRGASAGEGVTSSSRGGAEPAGGTAARTSSAERSRVGSGDRELHPSSVGASSKASAEPRGRGNPAKRSGKQQPLRRSSRAATMASSNARPQRPRPELSPPSAKAPLERADTFFLVGTDVRLLSRTTAWLEKLLPEAVVLGGLSKCALVVGDQVRSLQ